MMDPAEARRKARAMTHNLTPQTGLNLIKLTFIDIIISLDDQRMSKKQREQKMDMEVLSLHPTPLPMIPKNLHHLMTLTPAQSNSA
jgi:hypothetical protein